MVMDKKNKNSPETVLIIYRLQCVIKVVTNSPGKGRMIQPQGEDNWPAIWKRIKSVSPLTLYQINF